MKTPLYRKILFCQLLVVIFAGSGISAQNSVARQSAKNYEFKNGNWFDGKGFTRRFFYSVNGFLTGRRPAKIDESIDLANGFVIPPFGDAHTHNLDGVTNLEKVSRAYLDEGTFYVQVLGNNATGARRARPFLNKPATPDAVYANGSLTSTYGHPFMVYEPLAMGIYGYAETQRRVEEIKKSRRAENNAYWFLDSKADVDAKWEKIIAAKPDIIKIMIIDAENYQKNLAAGDMLSKGLSPEIAAYTVQKAHAANLRVYAHIETASDFRIGVRIGVDGFAHAPGYGWDGRPENQPDDLTLADIKLAARKKVVVIPTSQREIPQVMDFGADGKGVVNQERFSRVLERQKRLFNLMHRNGVRLAFGLDNYGTTLMPEIWHFHDNKFFDNLTLLKIAVETTPQSIFPTRRIGRLRAGYEANFLVLGGNPLTDFKQIKNIKLRFKQGFLINFDAKN